MKISFILPTYNEAGNIISLIKQIFNQPKLKKFIVIDDSSSDGTAKKVKQYLKKFPIKLIVRKKQRGLATAILTGINKSSGEILILMDTDFNHQPKDIHHLLEPIIQKKAEIVIGSRYISGGGMHKAGIGSFQFLTSKYGNLLVNRIILNLPVHESLSGFVAVKKSVLNKLNINKIFQGYGDYCIRLLYRAKQNNFRLTEVPVIYGKRQYGQSKSRLFKMIFDYFLTALKLKFS